MTALSRRRWLQSGPLAVALGWARPAQGQAHLTSGGVDLLITGHTHRHAWMAPDATRPFGQLTGGGPRPQEATLIRADADTQRLTARMFRLDGTLIGEYVVPAR